MKKLSLAIIFVLLAHTLSLPAFARERPSSPAAPSAPEIPERDGDYQDPVYPNIRVRVFVHGPKQPVSTETLSQCLDPDSTATVSAAGWKLPNGNWTYNLNPSSTPSSVGSANLPTIARRGFDEWEKAQGKVKFVRGVDTLKTRSYYDGQNIIAWARLSGNYLGVTYIRYNSLTKNVVDVDTLMNKRVSWSWIDTSTSSSCGDPNSYDAQSVIVHEDGHWLGLDDEYDALYINNTMYGYGFTGDIKSDTLTTGDKTAAAAIYP